MFWRKRKFQRVVLDRKIADQILREKDHPTREAVNILIGTVQREEGEDVYRVYDLIQEDIMREAGVIGTGKGEGVAEKIGLAEGIDRKVLSTIQKKVNKSKYDSAIALGFSHSHTEMKLPSGKDIDLMRYKYPSVLQVIHVRKDRKLYAYNGECDLLSIKDGTLSPEEGLQVEYRDLPYNPDVERLKARIISRLEWMKHA